MTTTVRPQGRARTATDVLAAARCVMGPPKRLAAGLRPTGLRDAAAPSSTAAIETALPTALVFGAAKAAGLNNAEGCVAEAIAVELLCDFSALHAEQPDADLETGPPEQATGTQVRDIVLSHVVNDLAGRPSSTVVARLLAEQPSDYPDVALPEPTTGVDVDAPTTRSTAMLMSCACEMGAIAAHATTADRATLARFGHHIGVGFQLTEDLLGIWGNPSITGRPMYGDVAERVESPPVTIALQADSPVARELCELYTGDGSDMSTLHRMACMIELAGGRGWAHHQVEVHLTAARECLSALSPSADIEDLALLAGTIAGRAS